MHLWLFIDHAYIFRSPSATIFRVYNIKEYNKKVCVANRPIQHLGTNNE
jgi:hypothetical protein